MRREIKYGEYKHIYYVSEASITELENKWLGYICFRKQKTVKHVVKVFIILVYVVVYCWCCESVP